MGLECTAVSKPNTPRAPSGLGSISVAYGNIPAPGLGKLERASQESLRIVCGCLAESVAVKENLTNFKKIAKNRRRKQKEQKSMTKPSKYRQNGSQNDEK